MKKSALKQKSAALELFTAENYTILQNRGNRSKYHEDYVLPAFKLCLLGATNHVLAAYFKVARVTIRQWMNKYPEFNEAVCKGKKAADMEVAHSLYLSALDRVITMRQAIKVKEVYYDENGKRAERERVEVVDVEKHIPGDFRAQQFWLRNRHPEVWELKKDDSGAEQQPTIKLNLGLGQNPLRDEVAG